jgi:thymidylate synthase (FAD)
MNVRLISYSQTAENLHVGDDIQELIAYCARVSNPSNQHNEETSGRLLSYLAKHKHWSPFEMVSACLEIETTRDIARQILRHRSFSFQEFSQRYANPLEDLKFVLREARMQDPKNRQNSIPLDSEENVDLIMEWYKQQSEVQIASRKAYQWAIDNGIAKEQARAVLPEGMMESRLYVNGTIRSWIHFIELRSGNGTQLEHQAIAIECAKVIAKIFPLADEFIANP